LVQRDLNPLRNPLLLLLGAALTIAPSAHAQLPKPNADLTYDQVWMKAMRVEQSYANGYATVGFAPAILTIPDHPFTATRVYTEWARSPEPEDRGAPAKPVVTTTVTIARDSMGRIHFESSRAPGETAVLISDPVEHLHLRYELSQRTAQRCTQPTMSQISRPYTPPRVDASKPVPPATPAVDVPKSTKQELGTKEMEGELAYGRQYISYRAQKAELKSMLQEDWFTPELGVNLRESNDYSGQNRYTIETRDIKRGEPDPNLFQLPPGYLLPGQTESCVKLPD
jgi:hypothetical protein